MLTSYPIYLLELGDELRIVVSPGKADLGHVEFWESTACVEVASHFGVDKRKLRDLPYCQKRARVVSNGTVLYGEAKSPELLAAIRLATGEPSLEFRDDDHEKRLLDDVRRFRRVTGRGR